MHGTSPRSCLIAAPSFPLPLAAGFLCACSEAVGLASVAPPTNKDLTVAARAQKHSASRCIGGRTSPTHRIRAIYVWHIGQCSALRQTLNDAILAAPVESISDVERASGARRPVDMWTTQARCPHTHRPSNSRQSQFDDCRTAGLTPACLTTAKCHVRPSVTSSRRQYAIFMRILTAVHIKHG